MVVEKESGEKTADIACEVMRPELEFVCVEQSLNRRQNEII